MANVLSQGWSALMGLAFIPVYLALLGVEAYGLIGVFTVIQAWLNVMDLGMAPTINREMARFGAGQRDPQSIRDLLRTLEWLSLSAGIAVALLIGLAAPWLAERWLVAESLPVRQVETALIAIGLVVSLRLVEGLFRGALLGQERQVWLGVSTAVLATLRWGGAAATLYILGPSIVTFFLWQACVSIIGILWLAYGTYAEIPLAPRGAEFSPAQLRGIYRFAGGVAVSAMLTILLTQLDKILLSKLLSLSEFGYYVLAGTVAGGLYQLTSPIFQAFYPRLSAQAAEKDKRGLSRNYHNGAQMVSVMVVPIGLLIAFFSEPLLMLWTQDAESTAKTAPMLAVLTIGTMLNCFMNMPMALLLANGWPSFVIRANAVAVALLVPAILIVVPRFGAMGGAWIWLVLNSGYMLISIHFMHKTLLSGEKARWYFQDILIPVAIGTMAVAAGKIAWSSISNHSLQTFLLATTLVLTYLAVGLTTPVTNRFFRMALTLGRKNATPSTQ